MATTTLSWATATPGTQYTTSKAFTNEGIVEVDTTIASGETDKEVAFALDVSQCVVFEITSDYAITVETNSGSAPDNTIALVANVPYRWCTGWYVAFKLTVDVTKLFITNASGSTAALRIRALYDSTP